MCVCVLEMIEILATINKTLRQFKEGVSAFLYKVWLIPLPVLSAHNLNTNSVCKGLDAQHIISLAQILKIDTVVAIYYLFIRKKLFINEIFSKKKNLPTLARWSARTFSL